MKVMPLTMAASLSIATGAVAAIADGSASSEIARRTPARVTSEPIWPNTGVAERELVADDDTGPENMFVEHANGKWTVWVIASPVHGQAKALDFFSGEVEDVTVKNPGDYADSFVDASGVTHKLTFHPDFYFKGPRPGGAIGNNVHVNVASLKLGSGTRCTPELEVSERLTDDLQSRVWRKSVLYPGPVMRNCPSVPWNSSIGTGLELRDGTMLIAAGKYVFRVSVDDLSPIGSAPNLHVVDEADVKAVIERAKGETTDDGNAYLTDQLRLNGTEEI